jgi:phosphopantothenoylcysteine decarboxylase / phosphopantothenate---cysteine ligase
MEIVLCITGSIAAIEAVKLAREISKHEINVKCFMSDDSCRIIHPNSMRFATGQEVVVELTGEIEHVKFAKSDLILVAPATANVISKFAYKIADNPINTLLITAFGYSTPIVFVPSMHFSMYNAIHENIEKLKKEGTIFINPKINEGIAKFPDRKDIVLYLLRELSKGELSGKKVLISAGATYEKIDPVRGITNRSSGKMGVEIAKEAFIKGADVTLVCGNMNVKIPSIFKTIKTESALKMCEKITKIIKDYDIFISAAAVSDFKINKNSKNSIKIPSNSDITLKLDKTPKIVNRVKNINPNLVLVVFKVEYNVSDDELIEYALEKKEESNADLIVANDVSVEGGGFGSNKNQVILIGEKIKKISLTSKKEIATKIIEKIIKICEY